MTRRAWLNLALLSLVIILGVLAYFEPGGKTVEEPSPLLALTQSQVTRIQIQARNNPPVQLERSSDGWMITDPIQVAASDYRVNNMLQLLGATSYSFFPVAGGPLSGFGLEHPAGRIVFNDQVIEFGDNEPINNHRYVRVGEQIHLIDDRYYYQSQMMLTALVDTALVPAGRSLKQILLPDLTLQQQQGQWQARWRPSASKPTAVELRQDAIDTLVDEWRRARAMRIDRYQADMAEDEIELEYGDGQRETLEILEREPELILGRRGLDLRYHLSADQGDRLLTLSDREMEKQQAQAVSDDSD